MKKLLIITIILILIVLTLPQFIYLANISKVSGWSPFLIYPLERVRDKISTSAFDEFISQYKKKSFREQLSTLKNMGKALETFPWYGKISFCGFGLQGTSQAELKTLAGAPTKIEKVTLIKDDIDQITEIWHYTKDGFTLSVGISKTGAERTTVKVKDMLFATKGDILFDGWCGTPLMGSLVSDNSDERIYTRWICGWNKKRILLLEGKLILGTIKKRVLGYADNFERGILHYDRGYEFLKKEEYAKAIKELEKAISVAPWHSSIPFESHYLLGYIYFNTGKMDKAINEYQKTLEGNPSYFDAHLGLGGIYYRAGQYELARVHYEEVLKIDPENKYARQMLKKLPK